MEKIIFAFLLIFSFNLHGQELFLGDSTGVYLIKQKTSAIYDDKDKTQFLLTKKQLRQTKTFGTSLIVHSKNDTINRVITISMTKKGQLSTEWYFSNQQLIYVYESFEFFNENKNEYTWKNFKGLTAWESRYYFINKQLKYHKHKGLKKIEAKKKENLLLKESKSILNYIHHKKIKP